MKQSNNEAMKVNKILVFGVVLIVAAAIYTAGTSQQILAQGLVERIVNLIKGTYEEGFRMADDEGQRFLYVRETPNYIAYTGNKADYGSHIVRLEKDGQAIEYSFVELRKVFRQEATASADLTEEQKKIVEEWQQGLGEIQEGLASVSGKIKEIEKETRKIVIQNQLSEGPIIEKIVKYEGIANNTDLAYRLIPQGISEEIILKELTSTRPIQALSFVFEINPLGLSFKDVGNGVWYFYDATGEAWLRFPKAYAMDADKKFTNNVSTQITKNLLIITLNDPEWLNDSRRQFPIVIYNAIELIPDKRGEYAPKPSAEGKTKQ